MEQYKEDFWIDKENLDATLVALAHIAGYTLDQDELDSIGYGIFHTDLDQDIWYNHSYAGRATITFRAARDEDGTDILFFKLSFDPILKA